MLIFFLQIWIRFVRQRSNPTLEQTCLFFDRLKELSLLAQHISTICLPNQDDYSNINWEGCVATGWGKDLWGQAGQYQVIMKQIEMNMVDHPTCQAKLR